MFAPVLALALMLQAVPSTATAPAPATVSGVVVQGTTGEPISGVNVTIARTDKSLGAFAEMVLGDRPPAEMRLSSGMLSTIVTQMSAALAAGDQVGGPDDREMKALSALPLDEIDSIIVTATGEVSVVLKNAPPATTDSQGRFTFNNLEPGKYKLIFSANGYAKQDYGQRSSGGVGIPIVLGAGQAKNDLVMRMSAVSAIAGHVLDKAGQPVAGVPVQVFRFTYDENGQKKTQRVSGTQTDDHGEYRIFYLSPGRYYLSAGNPPGQTGGSGGISALLGNAAYTSPNRIAQAYAISYYPGVSDANSASAIDVPPGTELNGVNLSLGLQGAYRVRGRVVDPRSGQPPPVADVFLNPVATDALDDYIGGGFVDYAGGNRIYNPADGTFEFKTVAPGTYTIGASLPNPNPVRAPDLAAMSNEERNAYFEAQNAADQLRPRASAGLRVTSGDVDGIVLTVGTVGSIAGHVRVEADTAVPQAPAPSASFLQFQLKSNSDVQPSDGGPQQDRPVKDDGTFRISGIAPGDYRLSVSGMPSGLYLKSARMGDADVLNDPLRFSGGPADTLEVVISSKVAQVDGMTVPGAHVVLIPDNRARTELFRPTVADANGHFTVSSITPGDYRLAAWEELQPFAFFDPALIRQAEENGKRVHIAESSKQSVDLTPIP